MSRSSADPTSSATSSSSDEDIPEWQLYRGVNKIDWIQANSFPYDAVLKAPVKYEVKISAYIKDMLAMNLDSQDPGFKDAKQSCALARLFQVALSQCHHDRNVEFDKQQDLSDTIDKLDDELADTRKRFKECDRIRIAYEKDNNEMRAFIANSNNDRNRLTETNSQLAGANQHLSAELARLRDDFAEVSARMNKVDRDNDELKKKLNMHKRSANQNEQSNVQVARENEHLLRKYRDVSTELKELEIKYDELAESSSRAEADYNEGMRNYKAEAEASREETEEAIRLRNESEEKCGIREQRALEHIEVLVKSHEEIVQQERNRTAVALEEVNALRGSLSEWEQQHPRVVASLKQEMQDEIDQRNGHIKALKHEISSLQEKLARAVGGGPGATANALEDILQSKMAVAAAAAGGGGGGGGAAGIVGGGNSGSPEAKAATQQLLGAMQKLQQENENLSLQLTAAENRLESQDKDMLELQKRQRLMEKQDPGLRQIRLELEDVTRKCQNYQDEALELHKRNKELQNLSAYCDSLKALCLRVGVTEEELASLNVDGGQTEIEVLRAEVAALQDEIHWLEKDRKIWMHKLRLQPILDTRLRLELGLTAEQLKQVDDLVEKMKAGAAVLENPQDDYYDKYHQLLEDNKRRGQVYSEAVQGNNIEEAILSAYRKHESEVKQSSAKNQDSTIESFSEKLREHLQTAPWFKQILSQAAQANNNIKKPHHHHQHAAAAAAAAATGEEGGNQSGVNATNAATAAAAAGGGGGAGQNSEIVHPVDVSATSSVASNSLLYNLQQSGDAADLVEALRQQRSILESQTRNIQELQTTLKERFEEVVRCREETKRAKEEAAICSEERDRFRDVLMLRSGTRLPGQQLDAAIMSSNYSTSSSAAAGAGAGGGGDGSNSQHNNNNNNNNHHPTMQEVIANYAESTKLGGSSSSTTSYLGGGSGGNNNNAGFDQMLAIERDLRKMLSQKASVCSAQEEHIKILQHEKADISGKYKETEAKATNIEKLVDGLQDHIKNLSKIIDDKEDRIGELSKIRDDLERSTNVADREVLQKIILLRQREARLLQRLRLMTEERDEALNRANLAHQRLVDSMSGVEFALNKSSPLSIGQDSLQTNNIALATATARIEEEDEIVASIDDVMGQLSKGQMLQEDMKVVADTWVLHSRLDQQRQRIDEAANISSLRSKIALLEDALAEREAATKVLTSAVHVSSSSSPVAAAAAAGGTPQNPSGLPSGGTLASVQIELETWKQKYAISEKRLLERVQECEMLSQSLENAREALRVVSDKISGDDENGTAAAVAAASASASVNANSAATAAAGGGGGGGSQQPSPARSYQHSPRRKAAMATLEKELTRMKSVNLSLVRAFAEMQGERKHLQILIDNKTRQIEIMTEQQPVSNEKTNQLLANVIRENTMLQQQLKDRETQIKTCRVSLLAAQANASILGNEAQSYRMSAQRLMRQYMSNMIPMIEGVRASLRRSSGALPLRAVKILHEHIASLLHHCSDTEDNSRKALTTIHSLRSELRDTNSEYEALQAIRRSASAASSSSGSGNNKENGGATSSLLNRGGGGGSSDNALAIIQRDKLLTTAKATARLSDRKIADLESQVQFTSSRLNRQESEFESAIQEITALETQAARFGDEVFFQRMIELREAINRHGAGNLSSSSGSASSGNGGASGPGNGGPQLHAVNFASVMEATKRMEEGSTTVSEYRDALQKQSQLQNEVGRLQNALAEAKQQQQMLDARAGGLRDELSKAENRANDAVRALDDERAKQRLRDERVQRAHDEQIKIIQTATEHNINSLKTLLTNKDKLIQQLEARCKQEKAAHMESSMLDSVRLERLHEQLFRENNTTLEKMRAMVEGATNTLNSTTSASGGAGGNAAGGATTTSSQSAAVAVHIETLTREVQGLRNANVELRQQNASLEVQLQSESTRLREALTSLSTMARDQQMRQNNYQPQQPSSSSSSSQNYSVATPTASNAASAAGGGGGGSSSSPSQQQQQQQQEQRSFDGAVNVTVEGALHRVNEQQHAITESMKRRERELSDQNNFLNQKVGALENVIHQLEQQLQLQRQINQESSSSSSSSSGGNNNKIPGVNSKQEARNSANTTMQSVTNTLMIRQLEERNKQLNEELSKSNQKIADMEVRHKRNIDEIVGAQSLSQQHYSPTSASGSSSSSLPPGLHQTEGQRLQKLADANKNLREELGQAQEQNQRLIQATALLRDQQRIQIDSMSSQSAQKRQEMESALTQRMQQIQKDSSETLSSLQKRVDALQLDLAARIDTEKSMRHDAELQAKEIAGLRVQLSHRDEVITGMKREVELANKNKERLQNHCDELQRQVAVAQQQGYENAQVAAANSNAAAAAAASVHQPSSVPNYNNNNNTYSINNNTTASTSDPSYSSAAAASASAAAGSGGSGSSAGDVARRSPRGTGTGTGGVSPRGTTTGTSSGSTSARTGGSTGRSGTGTGSGGGAKKKSSPPSRSSPPASKSGSTSPPAYMQRAQAASTSPSRHVDLPRDEPCKKLTGPFVDASTNTTPPPANQQQGRSSPPVLSSSSSAAGGKSSSKSRRQNASHSNSLEAAVSAVASRHVSSSNERQLESTMREMQSLQRQTEHQLADSNARLERERSAWESQIKNLSRQVSTTKEQLEKQNIEHKREMLVVQEERRRERDLARQTSQRVDSLRARATPTSGSARGSRNNNNQQEGEQQQQQQQQDSTTVAPSQVSNVSAAQGGENQSQQQQQQHQQTGDVSLLSVSASSGGSNNTNQQQQQAVNGGRTANLVAATAAAAGNIEQELQQARENSCPPSSRPNSANNRKTTPTNQQQAQSIAEAKQIMNAMETRHATEIVKLHDQNRKARKELERTEKKIKQLEQTVEKERTEASSARTNLKVEKMEREKAEAKSKMDRDALNKLEFAHSATSRAATSKSPSRGGEQTEAESALRQKYSLKDVCEFTARLLSLEEELEATKRTLRVDKEIEVRQLASKNEQLQSDLSHLEKDNELLRNRLLQQAAGAGDEQQQQQSSTTTAASASEQKEKAKTVSQLLAERRELEQQLLHKDGQLLDLRFERESLKLRAEKLEMHIRDLLKASEEANYRLASSSSSSSARGGGRKSHSPSRPSSSSSSGGGGDASAMRSHGIGAGQPSQLRISQLESVIDSMKGVVSKLQTENTQMKQQTVSEKKHAEALKDLNTLRARDKQLQEALQAMSFRVTQLQNALRDAKESGGAKTQQQQQQQQQKPGGSTATETVSLMRKLRAAQEAAEQYQLELSGLRRLVGDQTPAGSIASSSQRPSSATSASASAAQKPSSTAATTSVTLTAHHHHQGKAPPTTAMQQQQVQQQQPAARPNSAVPPTTTQTTTSYSATAAASSSAPQQQQQPHVHFAAPQQQQQPQTQQYQQQQNQQQLEHRHVHFAAPQQNQQQQQQPPLPPSAIAGERIPSDRVDRIQQLQAEQHQQEQQYQMQLQQQQQQQHVHFAPPQQQQNQQQSSSMRRFDMERIPQDNIDRPQQIAAQVQSQMAPYTYQQQQPTQQQQPSGLPPQQNHPSYSATITQPTRHESLEPQRWQNIHDQANK